MILWSVGVDDDGVGCGIMVHVVVGDVRVRGRRRAVLNDLGVGDDFKVCGRRGVRDMGDMRDMRGRGGKNFLLGVFFEDGVAAVGAGTTDNWGRGAFCVNDVGG